MSTIFILSHVLQFQIEHEHSIIVILARCSPYMSTVKAFLLSTSGFVQYGKTTRVYSVQRGHTAIVSHLDEWAEVTPP